MKYMRVHILRGPNVYQVLACFLHGSFLMKCGFILRSIIIAFNQPSGSMNFTNFTQEVLLSFGTGFVPGSIYGSSL